MVEGKAYKDNRDGHIRKESVMDRTTIKKNIDNKGTRYPRSVIKIPFHNGKLLHPTQKPTELLEWLVKTYTDEGNTVLDNTMGSGSTGVACVNTNRKFIGIELNDEYFEVAYNRINGYIYE